MRHSFEGWATSVAVVAVLTGCAHREPSNAEPSPSTLEAASPSASASSASPIPKEVVEAVLNPGHLPAYDGPTGSVEGTVYVTGPAAPDVRVDTGQCPAAMDMYGKLFREGTPASPNGPRPLADAVVIAVGYSGFYLPEVRPAKRITISANCAYPSRSITLTFGQRLEVANQSKIPFAPSVEGDPSPAVMMTAPREMGDPIRLYPRRPGHSVMTDVLQPFVHEDLYVLRQPLHTTSLTDGHYRLDGLPVGKLSVRVQHPGVESEAQAPVDVVAGVVQKVDLTLEYAPKAPKASQKPSDILR
jgi:hypothetical protein